MRRALLKAASAASSTTPPAPAPTPRKRKAPTRASPPAGSTPSVPEIPTATTTPTASPAAAGLGSAAATLPSTVAAPPDVTIPAVPAGFVAPSGRVFMGHYASEAQVIAAPAALADLRKFASYTATLGASAPEESAVADPLSVAIEWRQTRDESDAWATYSKVQDAIAWRAALAALDKLKPAFLIAVAQNPALATQYAGLAQLFNAGKVAAKQAAATKKRAAKAEAKAGKAAIAAQAAAAAAAAATAAANAAAAAATPTAATGTTKAVTVNA